MNRIKDLIIQFCKFGAVGGLCFGIDYGLMIFFDRDTYHALFCIQCRVVYRIRYCELYPEHAFCFYRKGRHDEGTGDGYFCGTQYDRACDEPDDHVVCRRTFRNVLCSSKNILHHVSYYV